MGARLSPDGMYYWDGSAWQTTLSADGRFRWDGSTWQPVSSIMVTPYGMVAARPGREPTSWTKPLQYAVAGWYVWSILYVGSEPLWMGSAISQVLDESFVRQQQANPGVSPPPVALTAFITSVANVSLWITALLYSAVFIVVIVGTWKRWTWMYYVVLVLLGLTSLLVPLQLAYLFVGAGPSTLTLPAWINWLNFLTGLPAVALFICMLIALVKRGPWATRSPQLF